MFVTRNEFDANVKDFEASYEKILTLPDRPTVTERTFQLNPPVVGRFIIFQKHKTISENLEFADIEIMAVIQ